jgi:hypothetical protein
MLLVEAAYPRVASTNVLDSIISKERQDMAQVMQAVEVSRMLNATPAVAHRLFLTDVGFREWLSDSAYVQPRAGGRVFLSWNSGFAVIGTYESRDKDQPVVFTWQVVGEPDVSRITASFEVVDGGTRVTITHDGPSAGPDGRDPQPGWEKALDVLQSVAEQGDDIRFTRRPMLGIMPNAFVQADADRLGLEKPEGILLSGVLDNMGAKAAGLQKDDVILKLDGKPTNDFEGLVRAIGEHVAGDTVDLEYWRNGVHKGQLTFSKRDIEVVPPTAAELADKVSALLDELNIELKEVLKGVTEEEASHCPAEAEWNVKEVIAHLIFSERDLQFYLTTLNSEDESIAAAQNIPARVKAFTAVYVTLDDVVAELLRTQKETVEFIRNLSPEFVAHTPTYVRFGQNVLGLAIHPRLHFDQIREAIAAARA